MGIRTTVDMARLHLAFLLMTGLITSTLAIEFTPNSGCAPVCMDNSSQNASNPDASTIQGSDIVCAVGDYQSTAVGQKFENCLNCLQNSSTSTSTENDVMWFLYNLRYAFNTCVFGTANASIPVSTPCSTDMVCGPLETALQSAMNNPSISTEFSYCGANQNSFLGTYLGTCSTCLRENPDTSYLANFLVALHAGCVQQPPTGVLIGLDSSVFNINPVNITAPIVAPSTSTSSHKKLSQSVIIGVAVGGGVLLVILAAMLFVCIRKRMARRKNARFKSRLDGRYGAETITVPIHGAYIDPGLTKLSQPEPHENFSLKRLPPTVVLQMPPIPEPPRAYSPRHPEEYYYAQEQPFSKQHNPPSHLENVARQFGLTKTSNSKEPSPSYSPPGSTQPSHEHSPVSAVSQHSTSPFANQLITPATGHSASTTASKPKISPSSGQIISNGLPRAPSRNESVRTVASAQDVRRTRDLSASRNRGERSQTRGENQISGISGPMVEVATRYEEEQELQRVREQEQQYRMGFLSPAQESHERGNSSEGEEMWPGNY